MKIIDTKTATTKRDTVVNAIEMMVFNGELVPGDRLIESEIVRQLSVSRTSVREAFITLEKRNLVKITPNKGARILDFSEDDIRQLYYYRACLEVAGLKKAFKNFNEDHFADLDLIIHKGKYAAKHEDTDRLLNTDLEFHSRIMEIGGNTYIIDALNNISFQMRRFVGLFQATMKDLMASPIRHEKMFEVFRSGDEEAACDALEKHILEHSLGQTILWLRSETDSVSRKKSRGPFRAL
jgi:DNA-binding GntR family transcriptional regulator